MLCKICRPWHQGSIFIIRGTCFPFALWHPPTAIIEEWRRKKRWSVWIFTHQVNQRRWSAIYPLIICLANLLDKQLHCFQFTLLHSNFYSLQTKGEGVGDNERWFLHVRWKLLKNIISGYHNHQRMLEHKNKKSILEQEVQNVSWQTIFQLL